MSRPFRQIAIALAASTLLAGCGAAPSVAPVTREAPRATSKTSAQQVSAHAVPAPHAVTASRHPFLTRDGAVSVTVAPAGDEMAYAVPGRGLMLARPDGTLSHAVAGTNGGDTDPAWSPDGKAIAFVRTTGASAALMNLTLATGHLDRLLAAPGALAAPSWTPNGRALVMIEGANSLVRMDLGAAPVALFHGAGLGAPSVSPDGRSLVFEWQDADGRPCLARTSLVAGTPQTLPVIGTHPRQPSFSPSGKTLAYMADDGLYLAQADGSAAHRIDTATDLLGLRWDSRLTELLVTAPRSSSQSDVQAIALPPQK